MPRDNADRGADTASSDSLSHKPGAVGKLFFGRATGPLRLAPLGTSPVNGGGLETALPSPPPFTGEVAAQRPEGASRMKIYAADKSELMQVSKVERQGDNLVLKGKVFGTMPMAATLTPEEARNFRKLLTPKLAWFLITLPFRKGGK